MENHAPGDVLEEGLQSPRSPPQSSYGGSDVEDNDVGDQEIMNEERDQNETEKNGGSNFATNRSSQANETAAPSSSNVGNDAPAQVPGQSASNTTNTADSEPRFKYKYPEAYPTPPGWDHERWNKAYTAADSRIYNHNGKKADISRQKRKEGLTRVEALRWEEQRTEREAKKSKKATTLSQKTASPAPAPSSTPYSHTPTTSVPPSSTAADMVSKRNQKKRKAPASASMPVASSSSQRPRTPTATMPQDLSSFGSTQTLADRIKGKAAASAAASSSSYSVESGTALRAESEKASQPKKGGIASVKKQATTAGHLHTPPGTKTPGASKAAVSKQRGSKSGTPASVPNDVELGPDLELFSDDEAETGDETATYCVCNGPESTYMISCDRCNGWFHRRVACLGEGDVALYKEFEHHIDNWYCPPCKKEDPTLAVTWYRICRRKACNKPAAVAANPPSKYCSHECAVKFFDEKIEQAPPGPEPSRGGALTQPEIAYLLNSVSSVDEFKALGKAPPKLRGKGKVVSKQYLRNIVAGSSTSANADGANAGKVFENKAEYKDHKEKAKDKEKELDELTERRVRERSQQAIYERYNQKYDGPEIHEDELYLAAIKALGPEDVGMTNATFMEFDWEFLQLHGKIHPSEAQAIDELQMQMQFKSHWIGILDFKNSFMKALHKHVNEILESKGTDTRAVCGYLPQISMSDHEFKQWLHTEEGAKICDSGKYEPLDPREADAWKKKSEAAMCMHSAKKHPMHHRWYEVHERENNHRIGQLSYEFNEMLKDLNELHMVVENRIYTGEG